MSGSRYPPWVKQFGPSSSSSQPYRFRGPQPPFTPVGPIEPGTLAALNDTDSISDVSWQAGSVVESAPSHAEDYEDYDPRIHLVVNLQDELQGDASDRKYNVILELCTSSAARKAFIKRVVDNGVITPRAEGYQWCRLSTMATNKAASKDNGVTDPEEKVGYIQGSHGGQNKVMMLHHVLALERFGLPQPGQEGSHGCGNSTCTVVGHAWWDDREDNENRKRCLVWVPHPTDSTKVINACLHSPRCIRAIPGVSWREFDADPRAYILDYDKQLTFPSGKTVL